jgi:phospholipid/cholesterol/gamma-HCH transport system substrate-binding protein
MSGRFALQVRRYGRSFMILIAVALVGTACGFYILLQQRLPNPFQTFYHVNGTFPTVAAVAPGLGEPVNVAGVRVGQITGVDIKDGQGIIHMAIDPGKLKHVYNNAHADLFPNTPLKDMEVNIAPGKPSTGVLKEAGYIPVSQTTSPTDADDLLQSLDTDTRTWFTSLITDLDQGTTGRGADIRKLLYNLGPTMQQLRQIGDLLAARRHELQGVVHNLGVLTKATSQKDTQLAQVVQAGDTTVRALANQDVALQQAITRLPGTLSTTRSTLADLTPLANALGPTATALLPTARNLPTTLKNSQTLFSAAALLPLGKIPSFVNAVVPLAGQLPPIAKNLKASLPPLTASFKVLNYVTNELSYNAGGKNQGFLYWLAWFAHNLDSFVSSSDANGSAWRSVLIVSCGSLKATAIGPLLQTVLGTTFGC